MKSTNVNLDTAKKKVNPVMQASTKCLQAKKKTNESKTVKSIKVNRVMKQVVYTRCTQCNSLRERLVMRKGCWSFRHDYCMDCGGVLDITSFY